jgi:hypothetical protein
MINTLKTKKMYGSFPKQINFQNSEYEVLAQVGPKNAWSQNFGILAFEGGL